MEPDISDDALPPILTIGTSVTISGLVAASSYNGAYLSFSESVKGTLLPGQLADIAVTSRDLFGADADEILESSIDLTILEGDVVYDRLQEHAP